MNHEAGVIRQLRKMGIDPTKPIPEDAYAKARILARTIPEIIKDGTSQIRAKAEKTLQLNQVNNEKLQSNLNICRKNTCGAYGTLANGVEYCKRCTCKDKELISKLSNAREACPNDPPLWDNRKI